MVGARTILCFSLLCSFSLGTPFLDGRFVATSDVDGLLGLGLDLSMIKGALDSEQREEIYSNVRVDNYFLLY